MSASLHSSRIAIYLSCSLEDTRSRSVQFIQQQKRVVSHAIISSSTAEATCLALDSARHLDLDRIGFGLADLSAHPRPADSGSGGAQGRAFWAAAGVCPAALS